MKKINSMVIKAKNAMAAKSGEAYMDMVIKIVIIAVLGVVVFTVVRRIVGNENSGMLGNAKENIESNIIF